MVVVLGREPEVLVGLAEGLRSRDLASRVLADGESLFDVVWEHGAKAIVAVDALPRLGGAHPGGAPIAWDEVLRAARSPKRPRVVFCTAHPEDPSGARLRSAGVGYVTVHAGTLVRAAELGLDGIRGRTVHVAKDLRVPDGGVTLFDALIETLVEATVTPLLGHVFDARFVGDGAWPKVIERLGGRPRATSRTLARVMSWVGARALVDTKPRLPREPQAAWAPNVGGAADRAAAPSSKEVGDERTSAP